jgi:hypothetical protein
MDATGDVGTCRMHRTSELSMQLPQNRSAAPGLLEVATPKTENEETLGEVCDLSTGLAGNASYLTTGLE